MTYRNYYLMFLTSIIVSLTLLIMRITDSLIEIYDIIDLLDYILYGIGVFIFTTHFMTDSRVNQLVNISQLKYYLLIALAIGFMNSYTFRSVVVALSIEILYTIVFGIISLKYLDKRIKIDFVGLAITYLFFTSFLSVIVILFDIQGYRLSSADLMWIFYVGASLVLYIAYLIIVATKGSQMPEVADSY